ncbi:MAG: Tryptophanyl-tRNA synthetase, partial [uncultured Gemmatimonadetes bacterium]
AHSDGASAFGHPSHRQLLRGHQARPGPAGHGRGVPVPGRPSRAHLARGRQRAPRERTHRGGGPARLRAGSGAHPHVAPVGRDVSHGADVDPLHRHADGADGAHGGVQGEDAAGHLVQRGAVHLSHPAGRRHRGVRRGPRSRGQGPEAAPGGHARHRRQDQRGVRRRHAEASGAADRRRRRRRPGARRAEDEQELRQHHRHLHARKSAPEAGDVDRDGFYGPGGSQGPGRIHHRRPVPPVRHGRAGGRDEGRVPRRRRGLRPLQAAAVRGHLGVLRAHAPAPRRDPGPPRLRGRGAGRGCTPGSRGGASRRGARVEGRRAAL